MIDWAQIESLRAEMGDSFDELVEVFLVEVDGGIERLDRANPPRQMAADLHFLKGAALNLGFAEFAELCSKGEMLANQGGIVDLEPVRESFCRARAAFLDGLAKRKVA